MTKEDIAKAIQENNIAEVEKFIEAGFDFSVPLDDEGNTALHWAVAQENEAMVQLLSSKSNINATNQLGYTALHYACYNGQNKIVQILITAGANINIEATPDHHTPFYLACMRGHSDIARELLLKECEFGREKIQTNILSNACQNSWADLIELLLKYKVGEALKTLGESYYDFLLGEMYYKRKIDIVKIFLESGLIIDTQMREIYLGWACRDGYLEIAEILSKGVNLQTLKVKVIQRQDEDNTLLQVAVRNNHLPVVKLLLDKGCTNIIGENGQTPLGIACWSGYLDIIKEFLLHGCKPDINEIEYFCQFALNVAREDKIVMLTEMLVSSRGIDITKVNDEMRIKITHYAEQCLEHTENISTIMKECYGITEQLDEIIGVEESSDSSEVVVDESITTDLTGNVLTLEKADSESDSS